MNVIDFPGQNDLKSTKRAATKLSQGQKLTRQEATNAYVENQQLFQGLTQAMGRLVAGHQALEGGMRDLDTHLGVLLHALLDKGILTKEDLDTAWDKHFVQPQEEELTKYIENLKQQSTQDAVFATVLEKVRTFTFEERDFNGTKVDGTTLRRMYMQALVNPESRVQALAELRNIVPDLPELVVPEEEPKEEITHPDCHYCGLPECTFCNPLTTNIE